MSQNPTTSATLLRDIWRRDGLTFAPPPKLTLSEWADRYAYLSPESAAEPGKWKTIPYQKALLDAFTEPRIEEIDFLKSARVGYTKILNHAIGYYMHQDPAPILVVQPTVDDAEGYSKDEIAPMLRDTPCLAGLVGEAKSRDTQNTILKKTYPGGTLTIVGANSARGFRRLTTRVVLFDEVDGYPPTAGQEGDQIQLGIKRSETFWNRKIAKGSTPTVEDASRIEAEFSKSDQGECYVPCPHCEEYQVLRWRNLDFSQGANRAAFVCEHCGAVIEHKHKRWMVEHCEWRGDTWTYRNGEFQFEPEFSGHIGFRIWAGYSYSPNSTWPKLAAEFLKVKDDPVKLKTFVNTVLGETWKEGQKADASTLLTRRENYGPESIPPEVLLLSAGVDVQDDRLEAEVVGWGEGYESWGVEFDVIYGDPAQDATWQKLDDFLWKVRYAIDGRAFRLAAAAVDTGGHHTQAAYRYCLKHESRNVYAIKGQAGAKPLWPKRRPRRQKKSGVQLYMVGVDTGKEAFYSRLKIETPGPGYCHFPVSYDDEWFAQATAETVITKYIRGFPQRVWHLPKGKRNEALDCRNYASIALAGKYHGREPPWRSLRMQAERMAEQIEIDRPRAPEPEPQPEQIDRPPPEPRRPPPQQRKPTPRRAARAARFRFRG